MSLGVVRRGFEPWFGKNPMNYSMMRPAVMSQMMGGKSMERRSIKKLLGPDYETTTNVMKLSKLLTSTKDGKIKFLQNIIGAILHNLGFSDGIKKYYYTSKYVLPENNKFIFNVVPEEEIAKLKRVIPISDDVTIIDMILGHFKPILKKYKLKTTDILKVKKGMKKKSRQDYKKKIKKLAQDSKSTQKEYNQNIYDYNDGLLEMSEEESQRLLEKAIKTHEPYLEDMLGFEPQERVEIMRKKFQNLKPKIDTVDNLNLSDFKYSGRSAADYLDPTDFDIDYMSSVTADDLNPEVFTGDGYLPLKMKVNGTIYKRKKMKTAKSYKKRKSTKKKSMKKKSMKGKGALLV